MTVKVSLTVNGKPASAEVEERTLLVNFIRDNLRLTGTHVGCDTAQCGACTIHMNGRAVKSCNMLAMQAEGAELVTIEGIAKADGTLHPMQEAFRQHHGLQCGFCTPGMVMSQPQGRPLTLAPARSSPVNTAMTPGALSALSFLIDLILACACGERTKYAWVWPGRATSSV